MTETNERMLSVLLYTVAAGVLLFWAPGHLLFPTAYHDLLGIETFVPGDPFHLQVVNMVGAVSLPLGVAALLAARRPARNRVVVQTLAVAGIALSVVLTFHLLTGRLPGREWYNVAAFSSLAAAFIALLPPKAGGLEGRNPR